jgi:hypothetical protein
MLKPNDVRQLLTTIMKAQSQLERLRAGAGRVEDMPDAIYGIDYRLGAAFDAALELHGQAVLAEHLHGEVVDLSTADR